MPKRCVVGGCSNVAAPGVPVHVWPKNDKLAKKWDKFVRLKRADWTKGIPGMSTICGEHFLPTDYENHGQWKAGFTKTLRLTKDAVPTAVGLHQHASSSTSVTRTPSRASHLMEVNRVSLSMWFSDLFYIIPRDCLEQNRK